MNDEELVDELNVHADTNTKMMHLYDLANEISDLSYEAIITMLQTAFWAGVEAGYDEDFAIKVTKLFLRS